MGNDRIGRYSTAEGNLRPLKPTLISYTPDHRLWIERSFNLFIILKIALKITKTFSKFKKKLKFLLNISIDLTLN